MEEVKKSKSKKRIKYLLYVLFVLVATGLALYLSLRNNFHETIDVLKTCDWRFLLVTLGVVFLFIATNALIIYIFCRLYTRKYHYHSAFATVMIGIFYSGITPGASGGQPMEAYTMNKQGIDVSNAASILIMWYIIYQSALILFGLVGFAFKFKLLSSMGNVNFSFLGLNLSIPVVPLIVIGFIINLLVILSLFFMSYSHKLHNWIMRHGISLGAKLRLVKNPDKTRETLRIKVENFRIELRRLQSNVPMTILLFILAIIYLILKFSIPWFAGVALNGYGPIYKVVAGGWQYSGHTVGDYTAKSLFDACFLSSFHQMVTGLIPLPGSAGVSELFFSMVFDGFYSNPSYNTAAQIIWRTASFHIPLMCGGFTAAFYRCSPKEELEKATKETFIDLQLETFEERKKSADTLFETSKLSIEEIRKRLKSTSLFINRKNKEPDEIDVTGEDNVLTNKTKSPQEIKRLEKAKKQKEKELARLTKKKNKNKNDDWGEIDI